MPQIVNTNIGSLNAQSKLNQSQKAQMTAMERLSSGLRINSAKDDAAGSAIVSRITSQVEGLQQASRNAVDATNLSKVAEGGLNDLSKVLGRVRQLAVQSATGSYSDSDRKTMAAESKLMLEELNRLSSSVNFNGTKLFDGSFNSKFQVGANSGDSIGLTIGRLDTKTLGSSEAAALNSIAKTAPSALGASDLVINGVSISPSTAASDTASFASKDASAIAKAAAINAKSAQTGVTATVNANEVGGAAMTGSAVTGTLTLNNVVINLSTTSDTAASRKATVEAINAKSGQTGVIAEDTGLDTGGVKLVAADGRNITTQFSVAGLSAATGVAGSTSATTYGGTFTLQSDKAITVAAGSGGDLSKAGLSAGTYQAQMASAAGVSATTSLGSGDGLTYTTGGARAAGAVSLRGIAAGDFAINGTLIGSSLASSDTASVNAKETSAISRAAAINAISGQTGVTATANKTEVSGATSMTAATGAGTLVLNGVDITITLGGSVAATDRATVVAEINKYSAQTGVVAVDTNDPTKNIRLEAADGRNITLYQKNGGTLTSAKTGLNSTIDTAATATPTVEEIDKGTFTSSVTLSSTTAFTVTKGNNAAADLSKSLGMGVGTYGSGRDGMSLDMIDLSTQDGASKALKAIDNALASIQKAQSEQGAFQNRMESVMSSLSTNQLNLTSTKSGMEDADFAAETAALSRAQVLQQAGVAMLAQANQAPQNVLSLLR